MSTPTAITTISTPGLNPSNARQGVFPNLAKVPADRSDREIEKELLQAGITPVRHTVLVDHPEVFTHLTGRLETQWGPFRFHRNWYYWAVDNIRVPLPLAEQMYADPIGKQDVRCGGHCSCLPPAQMSTRFTFDGKEIVPTAQKAELEHWADRLHACGHLEDAARLVSGLMFSDDPNAGTAFVRSYHIDSQAGLDLFVRAIKEGRF